MKKVIVSVVLVLVMLSLFVGCSDVVPETNESDATTETNESDATTETNESNATTETNESNVATEKEDYMFGYVWFDIENEWEQYGFACFSDAAEKKGVEIVEITTDVGDPAKALSGVEDLISKEVDAIAIFTITPELDAQCAKLANEADIPIMFMNALPAEGDYEYVSAVYTKYYDCGYPVGQFLSENWGNDSKVFFCLGALGMGITEPYLDAFDDAKADFNGQWEKVGEAETNWTVEKAINVTENFVQSGVEFDTIFCATEHQTTGVISVLKDAGLYGEIKIITTGGGPTGIKMLEAGEVDAITTAPVSLQGYYGFRDLWWAVNGATPPKETNIPAIFITKENIDDYISWEPSDKAIEYIGGLDPK